MGRAVVVVVRGRAVGERALVLVRNGALGPVQDQITALPVHGTSLPLSPFPPNSNTPIKIAHNAIEMIDQFRLLGADALDNPTTPHVTRAETPAAPRTDAGRP
jgi:hypothetical protein